MGIRFDPEWDVVLAITLPANFQKNLEIEVGRATAINAAVVAREMKKVIRARIPPGNSELTRALKKSSMPLVDSRNMVNAITGIRPAWNLGFAGLVRGRKGMDSRKINIARALHDGVKYKITKKMRALFLVLARARPGSKAAARLKPGRALTLRNRNPGFMWKPLSPWRSRIVVPGRPFVDLTLQRKDLVTDVKRRWMEAVQRSLRKR